MNSNEKKTRIKPRLPRGLADRGPAELAATRMMIETIRGEFERYGFEAVETPAIEYTDALGKFLPDQDRPGEGVFSFQDDDEQWLSLRYDLTAPLARYVAENFQNLALPYRSYRYGWVFRNEKPGPGRYRQFMQFDADTVGAASVAADAEMCMLAADTLEALGVERRKYVIKISNRKIFDGFLEAQGLGGEENAGKPLEILRAIDALDRIGELGVRERLGTGRRDESGDFTRGVGLKEELIEKLLKFASSHPYAFTVMLPDQTYNIDDEEVIDLSQIRPEVPKGTQAFFDNKVILDEWDKLVGDSEVGKAGIREVREIIQICKSAGLGSKRIRVDSSVIRGLEYYTGPVFEATLLFETVNETGEKVRFGSVGGGGRYDDLVARFTGQKVPATGFSIGVSRLLAALRHLGKIEAKPEPGPVVVTVFDRDRIADYQKMVKALRDAGIRAELYLGSGKMGPQMKYADRRNSPCVVIQGGDEEAKGEVQIKDLIEGAKAAEHVASREEWREGRPAQFSVREEKLVEAVRKLLARHGISAT